MMRGASADAYAATEEQLAGGDARTGVDLFQVASLLRTEPALRRVATDVSVMPRARAGLLRQMLEGKIDATALSVVEAAVAQRWTAQRDLADSLEQLGVVAVVRSTGDDASRLEDELFAVAQTITGSNDLRDALGDPARSREDKRGLVRDLLADRTLPATVTLVEQALSGSYRTVTVAIAEYQKVAAAVRDESVATVRVARPLSEEDLDRLRDALSRQYDRNIHLNVVVDPDVIGGIRVEIGDDVIDGTVASRLDAARRTLAG
jgi:F-type H+-transporting ATPase subunit delta